MTYIIQGETGDWELVCGLEVHGQVISNAKLFSARPPPSGRSPTLSVADRRRHARMLPVINETCIEQAVRPGWG
jgi:aspartyl-tRNA(Asn)/glutamyl-tRNA(Gln) amidotransferase subunit B